MITQIKLTMWVEKSLFSKSYIVAIENLENGDLGTYREYRTNTLKDLKNNVTSFINSIENITPL